MRVEYEQTIDVGAPAAVVWAVMSDVERWPEWTASVRDARLLEAGGLRPGQRVRLRQPRLPSAVWTVDRVEPERAFTWSSVAAGLRSSGEHAIEGTGPDTSRVVLRLVHSGVLAGPARLLYGGLVRRYVGLEAEGLKRAAEIYRAP